MAKLHTLAGACLALLLCGPWACGENGPSSSSVAGASKTAGVPSGYTVAATTAAGKRLVVHKAGGTSVPAALQAVVADLATCFDARPTVGGAFADARSQHWGGASFTARLGTQPVKGIILCSTSDQGADVAVAYCRADASAAEWAKLNTPAPTPGPGGPAGNAPAAPGANPLKSLGDVKPADVKLNTYSFPDGTGTVGLPDGWKTNVQTAVHGVSIQGPGGQLVTLGSGAEVLTPDSQMVRMQMQLAAQARQMGAPPPPPIQMLIAPYTGPVDALKNIVPQLSIMSQRTGGPALALDRIIEAQPATAALPAGQAAVMHYAITRTTAGRPVKYRGVAQMETYEVGGHGSGTWGIFYTELAGPDASFDKDLPVMLAIAQSLKTDPGAMQQATNRAIAANNQLVNAMRQANAERQKAFDDYFQAQQRNSTIRDRAAIDFDEVIRGTRTVEDTATGERRSVDLGNVNEIVDDLNRGDPGRYVQIPLRDEMAPLPPQPLR